MTEATTAAPCTEIIDAHHHLWLYDPHDYAWIGPEMATLRRDFLAAHLAEEMLSAGIAGTIVVQARQTLEETRWLLDVADVSPAILGVVGWLPLTAPTLPATLHSLAHRGKLKGARHVIQDEPDDDFILRDDFNRGIATLLDTGLVYDILIHERHLPQADAFVRRHPQQAFVLDHLAKPLVRHRIIQPWADNLARLAENPNVSCKLSGLVTEADWTACTLGDLEPYLDAALHAFGPERLLTGSDWPVCLLASGYQQWWSSLRQWCARLAPADCAKILGGNARRIYHLA